MWITVLLTLHTSLVPFIIHVMLPDSKLFSNNSVIASVQCSFLYLISNVYHLTQCRNFYFWTCIPFFFFSQGLVLTMEEFSRHFLCLLFFRPYFLPRNSQWNLGLEDTHGLFFLLAKTPVLLLPCEFRLNFFFQSRLTSKAGCFDITTEL